MAIIDRRGIIVDSDTSIRGVSDGQAIKSPCRSATTANVTLSGLQTIDGITLAGGDRILVKNQADATTNGIYVASSGNWTRASDFDGAYDVVTGSRVFVTAGSTQGSLEYYVSNTGTITIDSTGIVFSEMPLTATLSAAVTAADSAAAAAASSAATLGNQVHQYDTRAQAAAATIPVGVVAIKITRHATGYPLCYATYIPGTLSGPMAFQEAGGHYWELDVSGKQLLLPWFGAKGDGSATENTAVQAAMTASSGKRLDGMGLSYKLTATITGVDNVEMINAQFVQSGLSAYPIFNFVSKTNWQLRRVRLTGDGDPTATPVSGYVAALGFSNSGSSDLFGIAIEDCIFENFSGSYNINATITGSGGIKSYAFRRNKVYSKLVTFVDPGPIFMSLFASGASAATTGRFFDEDISDNYIDGRSLGLGFAFWAGHTRPKVLHNTINDIGADATPGTQNQYGMTFYDNVGAIGNTTTCAVDGEIADNIVANPPSAGIYFATARRFNVHHNTISGQSRTDNSTLPRGGISCNDLRDSTVNNNKTEDCWGGINIANLYGSETLDVSNNVISSNSATDSFGIRQSAPATTSTTSRSVIRDNDINVTGSASIAIWMISASGSSTKHGPTEIIGNKIRSPYFGIAAGGIYFNGNLVVKDNRYNGVFSSTACGLNSISASGVIVGQEVFESAATTGLCLNLDSTTVIAVNGVTFLGKAGSSACVSAIGAQGSIQGVQYRGVSASLRSAATSLGYTTPAYTGTPGDYVQNLNPDLTGTSVTFGGWYFKTGTSWITGP